jgi:acetylornithine/LysW-gamma-L-lysine aminotransferase
MNTQDIMTLEGAHTSGAYLKRQLAIVRGQGAHLWDAEGNRYIDCVGGQGSANLGHAHPMIVKAIQEQAATLMSCPEIFYNDKRALLSDRLTGLAPKGLNRVFFCNSGAEANEAALKFARLATGRTGVVATMRGFHGRTMGALSATWEKTYREPFNPLIPNFSHIPYNDLEAAANAITDQTSAVLIEVVQGEGGVRPGTAEFLCGVQALCRERGALFIVDEVQTGYGRTGKLFASEHFGLEPDLMPTAKSLAGGMPFGACLIGDRVGKIDPSTHGTTFGGNPLCCAAALAALDVLTTPGFLPRVEALGEALLTRFRETLPENAVREVRGKGLMIGIELRGKVAPILRALQERGVLALPAGATVLRLLPPLVIEKEDLETAATVIEQVLSVIPVQN